MSPSAYQPRGERLLPSLVDEIAATDPDRVFYSITKTQDPSEGFRDITAAEFARGVNRCAWHIEKHLGRGQNFPTLAYIGPQDPTYGILILACIKTGYKLLLLSARNTSEASLHLLQKTECKTLLLPPVFPLPVVGELVQTNKMNILEVPALHHWLEDGQEKLYPFTRTFKEARTEPFLVLQTSGSTGMPKPLVMTHGTFAVQDAYTELPSHGYQDVYPAMCAGSRVYLGFPVSHSAGITMLLPGTIYAGFTAVFGPFPPTSAVIDSIHVHGNVQQSSIAPMMLVDLIKNPKYLENLRRLDQVTFGGGPLPTAVGDAVSARTKLLNCMGATECTALPSQLCDPEDWAYLSYSPTLGDEFRLVADGLYEHFIVRNPKFSRYQAIFQTFPELDEWPMKDLYAKHPTKENLWLYRGRSDDMVVFSTNQKLNPIETEDIISANPAVSAALVVGTGRPQSSLLVEAVSPPTNGSEREQLLDEIRESIEAANNALPAKQQKLGRDMILFTSPEKPMLRAGKGTVQRKWTVDAYAQEIDALYLKNGNSKSAPYTEWTR
ncbi:hypothetical protein FSARC_10223 [Fusarium sarcochroum]|uniref:AMP-dependent synthetase/ligase domain-containing protein n=1 Tax=Fusarium sarcochroum TaxID=1208366 RepID=A0A8H4X520_9HYPO|nr:hypothetical protein FSARC_10223 [Fusarium sarcochroum]